MSGILNLSKPIAITPSEIGDVYFTGVGQWNVVVAKYGPVMATEDCTDYVQAVGYIHAPDGVRWSVAAYETVNSKDYDPNRLW